MGLSANVQLAATYNSTYVIPNTSTTAPEFMFRGTASVNFGPLLPSWAQTFFGSATVSAGFDIQYVKDHNSLSYVDAYTTIAGDCHGGRPKAGFAFRYPALPAALGAELAADPRRSPEGSRSAGSSASGRADAPGPWVSWLSRSRRFSGGLGPNRGICHSGGTGPG